METATHLGADAPASYALERSAPAEPAYLSTHDAAAVLRKLRQPKANDTDMPDPSARATTAAPEQGRSASLRAFTPVFDGLRTRVNALMESTAADAADDAAPVDAQDLRVPFRCASAVATGAAGGSNETAKAVMAQPDKPMVLLSSVAAWSLVGLGVAVVLVATAAIVRKRAAILAKWAGAAPAPSAAPTS